MIVNAIEAADRFRSYAGSSATEYAEEIEIFLSDAAPVIALGQNFSQGSKISAGFHRFPLYALSSEDSWPDTLMRMWQDFWNSNGCETGGDFARLAP
jgi:hypothetical protein